MSGPLRLLLLEDSPVDAELSERVLRKAGLDFVARRVEALADFVTALDDFRPDAILADYNLPGFTGMEGLAITRVKATETPFIFVSGTIGEERAAEGIRQGATDYIIKDRLARLPSALQRAMAEKALVRQQREVENRFRDLYEKAPLAYQSLDVEANIIEVNEAWLALVDRTRDEVIGRSITEFLSEDSLPTLACEFPRFKEIGRVDGPLFNVVRRDGSQRLVRVNGRIARDGNGNFMRTHCILTDVTDAHRAEEQMRLSATVFHASAEGILVTDADCRIVSANPAVATVTGYSSEEVVGQTPAMFKSGRHDDSFYRAMWHSIDTQGRWSGEIWNRRKNGELFPEWLTITAVRDDAGVVTHYIGSFVDITERKRAEESIRFMANHDALTGLPNRSLLDDRIQQAIAKSRRNEDHTAVLFLDLDRFKLINDTLGHNVGDRLLERIAEHLKGVLRETETVARLGGDEFIIVIPELENIDQVLLIAQKILDVVATPQMIGDRQLQVTPSIGISIFPDDGDDAATLLRNADTAMYHAKGRGRNNFQFFTQSMNVAVQERLSIESDLRRAIENQEFRLYYQPQVDCRDGRIVGMEALIRWQHPQRGLVSPFSFISIAEETGLIVPIGEWVLREACRQAVAWRDQGHRGLRMSVNLSARQFREANLFDQIAGALESTGLEKESLELELTEGMLMEDPEAAAELLRRLSQLGIRLALDDFGTGYSSLSYLKRFPIHRLKIDASFVRDLTSDANDAAIVNAIIALAASLRLEVIAEGVETIEQLRYLEANACCNIQGYYYSRPLPPADFAHHHFAAGFAPVLPCAAPVAAP